LSQSINGKTNSVLFADDTSITFTNFNLEGFKNDIKFEFEVLNKLSKANTHSELDLLVPPPFYRACKEMHRALYVAAGKHGRQSLAAAGNCNNSASRLYVTDQHTKLN